MAGTHSVHIEWPEPQQVHEVLPARRALAPLGNLGRTQVVRGVDVAGTPSPRQLAHVVGVEISLAQLVRDLLARGERVLFRLGNVPVHVAGEPRRVGGGAAAAAVDAEHRGCGALDVADCSSGRKK